MLSDTQPEPGWVESSPGSRVGWRPLLEVRHHRELVAFLAVRDLKVKYKQAVFGFAWAGFQPVVGVLVFTVVFHQLAGISAPGVPYVVYTYAGLAAWTYVSTSVTECTESLVRNSALVTKVYFPRVVAPFAAVLPSFVDLAVALALLAGLMAWTHTAPGPELLALPVTLAALLAVAFGVGIWLAALNVQFRDIRLVLGFSVQLWLFVSPVAYPTSLVPAQWRWLYALNPAVGALDLWRWSLLGTPIDVAVTSISMAVSVVLIVGGLAYFQRSERRFADVI